MNRVNRILFHPKYQYALGQIELWEKDRQFCRHGIGHILDVARLAYIHCLEAGADAKKDVVYASALLHDIGRYRQYEDGTPHEQASASLAEEILPDCSFTPEEQAQIKEAILGHRGKEGSEEKASSLAIRQTAGQKSTLHKEGIGEGTSLLGRLLYRADKMSRNCFACRARDACDWPDEKMNMKIQY